MVPAARGAAKRAGPTGRPGGEARAFPPRRSLQSALRSIDTRSAAESNAGMRSTPLLLLAPRASRQTAACIVGAGIATAALIASLPVPTWMRAGMLVAGLAEVVRAFAVRGNQGGLLQLAIGVDRRVRITDRRGVTRHGDVLDDTFVSGPLTVVVFRIDGRTWTGNYLVAPGTLSPADRRRLRVRLRLGVRAPGSSLVAAAGPPAATGVRAD